MVDVGPKTVRLGSKFKQLFPIKGSALLKLESVFDNYEVFLDFTNEDDFDMTWFKRTVKIDRLQMWLQKRSLDSKHLLCGFCFQVSPFTSIFSIL